MKIAQVVSTYPPYRGGMGAIAFEYTERLRARGHNVHVFTPRYEKTVGDPSYVHRIPSPLHWGNTGLVPSLAYRLKGFDLVHLHYPFFGGAEPLIVRKYLEPHQPLVMTYHMDVIGNGVKHLFFGAHQRLFFPWIMERVDRILVSSSDYAENCALARLPGLKEKISFLSFGVDLERFRPGRDEAFKKALNIQEDVPVLLFIGGLDRAHYFKGLPVLLQALEGLKKENWHLLVVGDGNLRLSFVKQARSLGLTGRVSFLGALSEDEKPRAFRAADFHLFPSIDRSEAFGLVALEAAASGLPSIASDLPGVRSVVKDQQTGFLFKPEDYKALEAAIRKLLNDVILRKKMGEAARQRAEKEFSWPPLIEALEEVYSKLAPEVL